MRHLAPFRLRWIEEPTSPDDVLGHAAIRRAVAPVGVATGEHCANRVMFKQLLQAEAIDYCQIDACRLGGVNEVLAVLLLAAQFGVPVCPHAGGLGLCEYVQHISLDRLRVRQRLARRPHDRVRRPPARALRAPGASCATAATCVPEAPGYSVELHPESLAALAFPDGSEWRVPDPPSACRSARPRVAVTRLGLGCAPLGNLFSRVDEAQARRDGRRGLGRRHPLLRHRAALRARPVRAAARRGAARRPRDELVRAATKVGRLLRPGPSDAETIFADVAAAAAASSTSPTTARCARSRRASSGSGSTASTSCSCTTPTTTRTTRCAGAFRALLRLRDEGVDRRGRRRA